MLDWKKRNHKVVGLSETGTLFNIFWKLSERNQWKEETLTEKGDHWTNKRNSAGTELTPHNLGGIKGHKLAFTRRSYMNLPCSNAGTEPNCSVADSCMFSFPRLKQWPSVGICFLFLVHVAQTLQSWWYAMSTSRLSNRIQREQSWKSVLSLH